jgi:hypothetical protein
MPVRCRFRVEFFRIWTLPSLAITVDNSYCSQNVLSYRYGLRAFETVEFCYGLKLLRKAFRFQTLMVSVTVSHFFMPVSCERGLNQLHSFHLGIRKWKTFFLSNIVFSVDMFEPLFCFHERFHTKNIWNAVLFMY